MRSTLVLLVALLTGCVDVKIVPPDFGPPPYFDFATSPEDMSAIVPMADLAPPADMTPPGPHQLWLTPADWQPSVGGWNVGPDGSWTGIGTLRARLPAGPPPTALLVDYSPAAGSTARIWLRGWQAGATADTTPVVTSTLIAMKTTDFVLSYPVTGITLAPGTEIVIDIVDDGVGGLGSLHGVRVTTP